MIDQAFILGAGLGNRMRPLTNDRPKPMVDINGKPIIDYVLDRLENENIKRCVINTHYLANVLEDHVRSQKRNFEIIFSYEETLLDTGGGLKKGLHYLDPKKPVFVVAGDSIWEDGKNGSSLNELANFWNETKMDIALLLQDINTMKNGIGDYDFIDGLPLRNKNQTGTYMWTSIRILHPRIFEYAPDGPFSFLQMLDDAQNDQRLHAQIHNGQWHHLSTPDDVKDMT